MTIKEEKRSHIPLSTMHFSLWMSDPVCCTWLLSPEWEKLLHSTRCRSSPIIVSRLTCCINCANLGFDWTTKYIKSSTKWTIWSKLLQMIVIFYCRRNWVLSSHHSKCLVLVRSSTFNIQHSLNHFEGASNLTINSSLHHTPRLHRKKVNAQHKIILNILSNSFENHLVFVIEPLFFGHKKYYIDFLQ